MDELGEGKGAKKKRKGNIKKGADQSKIDGIGEGKGREGKKGNHKEWEWWKLDSWGKDSRGVGEGMGGNGI